MNRAAIHHPAAGANYTQFCVLPSASNRNRFNKLETTAEQTHVRCLATVNPRRPGRLAARPTRQRLAVTDLLSELHDFRSAQQIHATLQERGDNIGLATIYRPLALMANSGGVDVLTHEEPHYSSTSPAPSPHWRPIDRAIVNLDIPTDAGKELCPDLDVVKPYLRYTGQLQSEPDSQNRPGAQRSGPVSCLVPDEADVSVANEPGRHHGPLTVS